MDVGAGLPDLQDVVVGDGRERPFLVSVPRNVIDLFGVPAVDEEQLCWPVARAGSA